MNVTSYRRTRYQRLLIVPDVTLVVSAIGIDPDTGQVTITRLLDLFGSQLMIITASDNGAENPSHSEGFVLTVGP